jgi:hypothetical protein
MLTLRFGGSKSVTSVIPNQRFMEAGVEILLAIGGLVSLSIAAYFFGYDSRQLSSPDRKNAVRF